MRTTIAGVAVLAALGLVAVLAALMTGSGGVGAESVGVMTMQGDDFSDVTGENRDRPFLLMVDPDERPRLELAWQTNSGWRSCGGRFSYTSPMVREAVCENLTAFVALGGTRLDKQAGDPTGAIVRAGFYKADGGDLLLPDAAPGALVKLRLTGVRFNQPVRVRPTSVLSHLKYGAEALESCGAPRELADVYLTANPEDDLAGSLMDERGARLGYLRVSGSPLRRPQAVGPVLVPEQTTGAATVRVERDGTVTLEAMWPYSAFRHVLGLYQDPAPGGFAEPDHFHVEFEAVPR